MKNKIEFSDLNKAGKAAVLAARDSAMSRLEDWGFDYYNTPFGFRHDEHTERLTQAIIDFLITTNQPVQAVPNERT